MLKEIGDMNSEPIIHQVKYILWVRSEFKPLNSPVYQGVLETVAGQKFEFNTLDELNRILCEMGGWVDRSRLTNDGSER